MQIIWTSDNTMISTHTHRKVTQENKKKKKKLCVTKLFIRLIKRIEL